MLRRGFTVIEIVITITIMGILLTLAVLTLSATQVNARDSERKGDIEALQVTLESFYSTGSENPSTPISGRYPSAQLSSNEDTIHARLPDLDAKILTAPGANSVNESFITATNAVQTTAGVSPQPTFAQYVYQPLQANGTLCTLATQECRKFNLFYRLETDNTVYMVTSKHQ